MDSVIFKYSKLDIVVLVQLQYLLHLLESGEQLQMVLGKLQVIAYEHGIREKCPLPGVIQRICAVNNLDQSVREDREPQVLNLEPN